MWFGTPNGVSAFAKGRWRSYSEKDGLPSSDVSCLSVDSAGVVWIGTASGLAFVDAAGIRVPRKSPAVLQEPITGIAADARGSIWIATSNHVVRASRDELAQGEIRDANLREYGVADGLHSVEGVRRHRSVVADARGRVWFSLGRGLSMVDTTRAAPGSAPAIAHVETVSADGTAIDLRSTARIPAGRQRLTFRYAGLSLAVPERVRFRYRLDGFDRDWSAPVVAREAVYTNLGPGDYRFRVMASNSDGEWSPTEAAVGFAIAPRVWQAGWFQLACVGALVLGSVGALPLPDAPGRQAAQRPVRGAARRADADRAGPARHAATGVRQRVHAAPRGDWARAARVARPAAARARAPVDGRASSTRDATPCGACARPRRPATISSRRSAACSRSSASKNRSVSA